MTYEVGLVTTFAARHHLVGDFGPATREHGHTYRVEMVVEGPHVQADGTLFDITHLERALEGVIAGLRDRDLNAIAALGQANPTAESVARYLFAGVAPALAQTGLTTLRLRVWESDQAYAGYVGRLT